MAALAVVAVAWYGVVQPIMRAREAAVARIETAAMLQSRLRTASPGGTRRPAKMEAGLAETVRRRAADLALSPESIKSEGEDVDIAIASAQYEAVVGLVAVLEGTDGATVQDLQIKAAGQPGMVSLGMRVTR